MNCLPNDIENIIMEYKSEMEVCEERIQHAVTKFLDIQAAGYFVRSEIINVKGACRAWQAVCNIISEAQQIIDTILDDIIEETQVQRLTHLQRALDHSMIRTVVLDSLKPFMEFQEDTPDYDSAQQDVPPILF